MYKQDPTTKCQIPIQMGSPKFGHWKCIIGLYDENAPSTVCTLYTCSIDASVEDLSPWPKILCEFIFTEELKALEAWFKEVIFPTSVTWIMLTYLDSSDSQSTCDCGSPENAAFQMTSFLARCTFLKLAASILWTNAIQNKHEDQEVF